MLRTIIFSFICFLSISVMANQDSRCNFEKHDLSIFLEPREKLEKRFVVSAHDLMMAYCNNYSSSDNLQSVFSNYGINDKDVGVKVLINAVKVVSPYFKGLTEVQDNRQIFSYIRGFYQKRYQKAENEKDKQILAASYNITSLATVEIMNFR